jgi:ComF family protein
MATGNRMQMNGRLVRAWRRLVDVVSPEACRLCETRGATLALCRACLDDIEPLGPACGRCARPLAAAAARCGGCLPPDSAIASVRAPFRYAFPLDSLLHALKFRGDLAVLPAIALALQQGLPALPLSLDIVVPVPLHRRRARSRGFNQSELLARAVARPLGLPVASRVLRRSRDTPAQSALPAAARRRNVRGAFTCRRLDGEHVLLVDDVLTTGATAEAAARAMLAAGAGCVHVLVLMRAVA